MQAARARSSAQSSPDPPGTEEIVEALKALRKEADILERYLNTALDPWPTDYLGMQPLLDGASATSLALNELSDMLAAGSLREVAYVKRQLGSHWLVLATCDIQGAGFVCGAGLADSAEVGEQLAAQQALDRIALPKDFVGEISRCAEAVRTHKHHAGAREPAQQAAEALDGLSGLLGEPKVCAFCPCGKAWMAAISARVFHGNRVIASSADWVQEVAMALAAEVFISRLRWALRVPPDEPHAPLEWARTWQQRAAAKDPWGGVTRRVAGQNMRISQFGGSGGKAALEELLGPERGRYDQNAVLRAATRRRFSSTLQRMVASEKLLGPDGAEDQAVDQKVVRRPYEVTPQSKDPRRKEIVGRLPVERIRSELGAVLEDTQTVLISGGTGSGKSTQLPQFLLDDWRGKRPSAPLRVVVTQPRRIAAISVAERVAWERKEKIGETVGYAVQGNTVRPTAPQGTIEFVTVGTLLRRALYDPLLENCDAIVVDEVHERDMLTDFLLILVREVLPRRPSLRLVLMSATVDVETFRSYFNGCPMLEVPAGTLHPVKEVHLGDPYFKEFPQTGLLLEEERGRGTDVDPDMRSKSQKAWGGSDAANTALLELIEATIRDTIRKVQAESEPSAILCFLPGWAEIRHLNERLQKGPEARQIWALPLHSTLPKDEQNKVFKQAPAGKVKVILGTNIAESSVTIEDVTVVVDSGLQRELTYDPKRRMSSLDTVWVSQSNAVQRKGRAGRVRAGQVLRLYSKEQLDAVPSRPAPEMQRCDLAQSCLQAVALGRNPRTFLAQAPDPPSVAAVEAAMEELSAIDAIEEGEPPRLLPVGEVLARLPLEPLLGRAAMLGALLGLPKLAAAVLVVSGGRSPFVNPTKNRESIMAKQSQFCSWSDVLAAARALLSFEKVCQEKGDTAGISWARSNFLNPSQLNMFSRSKAQLLRDMVRCGLVQGSVARVSSDLDMMSLPLVEDDQDSAALLESWGEMEAVMDVDRSSVDETLAAPVTPEIDESSEKLLMAILCAAYPANLASRLNSTSSAWKTKSAKSAVISANSVNAVLKEGTDAGAPASAGNKPEWCLFGEIQTSSDSKTKAYLQNTTRLEDWQVAVFGGLRVKDIESPTDPVIELDGWISVRGDTPDTTRLLRALRRELQDAISWQALAALRSGEDQQAQGYLNRSCALLKVAAGILAGKRPDASGLELVRNWKPTEPSKDDAKCSAAQKRKDAVVAGPKQPSSPTSQKHDQSTTSKSEPTDKKAADQPMYDSSSLSVRPKEAEPDSSDFDGKSMVELKAILRDLGLKVSGSKAELVQRCLEARADR